MAEREPSANVDQKQCSANGRPVLRPGVSDYARLRRDGHAYVDKTGALAHLLNSGEFLFLARPRRFGKTLMLSTIECMYQGDRPQVRDPFVEFAHPIAKVSDELLLQSGYLTHHPARDGQPARLGWPNREVARTVLRDLARTHVGNELPGIERLRTCLTTGDYRKLPNVLLDCLYAFPYNIMDDEYSYHAALHGIFLGMGVVPRAERRELSGRYDLAAIFRGRACVFELTYNRSLREAQAQADRRQYGRSLLVELEQAEDATCIALHVTRTGEGQVRIEGAQRPVHAVDAEWMSLETEPVP